MSELLNVEDLHVHFPITGGVFKRQIGSVFAVNGVSFTLRQGETLGIVGESGCGKTTLGRALVRLYEPTSGSVRYRGREISAVHGEELRALRREIQMIFQDPYASLNPRMSIRRCLEEPMALHGIGSPQSRFERAIELTQMVGLRVEDLAKFPHEFSGGQRQRIGIARALALEPSLLVADEPVSALDVSIQSQVLNLLIDLQSRLGLTYVFISHDLTVVKYVSDRVAVMYLGHVLELASSQEIYSNPRHPYTRALLAAVPIVEPRKRQGRATLGGDVPSPSNPPPGCVFHTRCPFAEARCRSDVPELVPIAGNDSHRTACLRAEELDLLDPRHPRDPNGSNPTEEHG